MRPVLARPQRGGHHQLVGVRVGFADNPHGGSSPLRLEWIGAAAASWVIDSRLVAVTKVRSCFAEGLFAAEVPLLLAHQVPHPDDREDYMMIRRVESYLVRSSKSFFWSSRTRSGVCATKGGACEQDESSGGESGSVRLARLLRQHAHRRMQGGDREQDVEGHPAGFERPLARLVPVGRVEVEPAVDGRDEQRYDCGNDMNQNAGGLRPAPTAKTESPPRAAARPSSGRPWRSASPWSSRPPRSLAAR